MAQLQLCFYKLHPDPTVTPYTLSCITFFLYLSHPDIVLSILLLFNQGFCLLVQYLTLNIYKNAWNTINAQ